MHCSSPQCSAYMRLTFTWASDYSYYSKLPYTKIKPIDVISILKTQQQQQRAQRKTASGIWWSNEKARETTDSRSTHENTIQLHWQTTINDLDHVVCIPKKKTLLSHLFRMVTKAKAEGRCRKSCSETAAMYSIYRLPRKKQSSDSNNSSRKTKTKSTRLHVSLLFIRWINCWHNKFNVSAHNNCEWWLCCFGRR